ncbi:MAG: sialate O-acetylesterase [Planctomycetota bacterium]
MDMNLIETRLGRASWVWAAVLAGACMLLGSIATAQGADTSAASGLRLGAPFSDHMVIQAEAPIRVWGWDDPDTEVTVTLAGFTSQATAGADGRWQVELPELVEVGPYEMVVEGSGTVRLEDVVAGEVWWCSGQSNMVWPVQKSLSKDTLGKRSTDPMVRLMKVPRTSEPSPQSDVEAQWEISDGASLLGFSAVAAHFGIDLARELDRPVGLIQSAWGGSMIRTWVPTEELEASPHRTNMQKVLARAVQRHDAELKQWEESGRQGKRPRWGGQRPQHVPSGLANAMTHPFEPLSIRGVIWYQGESDSKKPPYYADLFKSLIASWRDGFQNPQLPVYFVQLPNFAKNNSNWAPFREMQRRFAQENEHVDMAVSIDVGEPDDIHPQNKQPVGERLARLALHHTYGRTELLPGGPLPATIEHDPSQPGAVRVTFTQVGEGLQTSDGQEAVRTFVLTDRSGERAKANAVIVAPDAVLVSAEGVTDPVDIRYANFGNPSVNLVNSEGLPASPFKLDEFLPSEPE